MDFAMAAPPGLGQHRRDQAPSDPRSLSLARHHHRAKQRGGSMPLESRIADDLAVLLEGVEPVASRAEILGGQALRRQCAAHLPIFGRPDAAQAGHCGPQPQLAPQAPSDFCVAATITVSLGPLPYSVASPEVKKVSQAMPAGSVIQAFSDLA